MLRSLLVKNYALIEEITVSFDTGLSIITGETGAGKSILLGALGLILGDRASSDEIRTGADKAIVEAEFDLTTSTSLLATLRQFELDLESSHLIIRREITKKGTSRAFVNDTPVSLSVLKSIGELLVDLHGQHEHQSLLNTDRHIDFLDEFAGLADKRKEYEAIYSRFISLRSEYHNLQHDLERSERERSFLEFQFQEIDAIAPKEQEDEQVKQELQKLEHSEELQIAASELHELLYEGDGSVFERLSTAKPLLEKLRRFDAGFESQLAEFSAALESIKELAHTVNHYGDSIEADPEQLETLRSRDLQLSRLKKKYGPALSDVLALYKKLSDSVGSGGTTEDRLKELAATLRTIQSEALKAATTLSTARKKAAKTFEKKITEELKTLGIEHGSFVVSFTMSALSSADEFASAIRMDGAPIQANKKGFDTIEFFISTNKGETAKPLVKVASGGEVSRIMLSIKTILSDSEQIPVLIFDEIDTGISGRIAQRVGSAMKKLSASHQLLAITHLGQIAAFADHHYKVEKSTSGAQTSSTLRLLSAKEHEAEIARLISGETVTDTSLKAARSLLNEARSLAA